MIQLTLLGLKQLCAVVEKQHLCLTDFELDNNPVGDVELNTLFTSISSGNKLVSLNLSNCQISSCEWARFLCFIESLSTLNLSHNRIGDDAFVQLMKCIENCACLRHLDLSYNPFGGVKCNVLQSTLSTNKGLYSFNLSGNRLDETVWTSISRGLLFSSSNLTLLTLASCHLSLPTALVLCEIFQQNQLISLQFSGNALPREMIADPRGYCQRNGIPATLAGASYLSADEDKMALSLPAATAWRESCARGLRDSLTSLEVVAQKKLADKGNASTGTATNSAYLRTYVRTYVSSRTILLCSSLCRRVFVGGVAAVRVLPLCRSH